MRFGMRQIRKKKHQMINLFYGKWYQFTHVPNIFGTD